MKLNPLRKRSKRDQARERGEVAVDALREAAESVRDQAQRLLDQSPEPTPEKSRGPAALVGAIAAVAAVGYAIRKATGGGSSRDFAGPSSVTQTAPLGPTDSRLNDPALKAKVESEIFAADDAPKGKVSVDVSDGVVTLRGTLDDSDQASELVSATTAIDGVRRVENLL